MLNYLVYRLLPTAFEQEQSADAGRQEARENKSGGRAVSFARRANYGVRGAVTPALRAEQPWSEVDKFVPRRGS